MKKIWCKSFILVCFMFMAICVPKNTYAANLGVQATALAVSSSEIQLKWEPLEQTESYTIYRRTSADTKFKKINTTTKTTYRDKTISAAVGYYYKIVPVSSETGEEVKASQTIVQAKAPAQTSIERVVVKSSTKLKIFWKAAAGSSGYQVLRSLSESGKYEEIARVSGKQTCAYTDAQVIPGKTYYYKICPMGQGESVGTLSASAKGKTIAQTTITSIASLASDRMQITWKKVTGAKSYEIYRGTKASGSYKKIAVLNSNTRNYIDRTVKSGKKYYYKVAAIGSMGGKKIVGGYSEPAAFRALQKVKISSVKLTAQDGLKIKWNKVTGATKYIIYRATSKSGSYQRIATVMGSSQLDYTDQKVITGKTYYYKVQAYSDAEGVISAGSGTRSDAMGASTAYTIMGDTTVTASQMAAFYNASGKKYPASVYKNKGAKTIEAFCKIVIDECQKEGVRGEVIFAQICLETGYLQFGGQVSANQCNFSGIGATDDGAAGATFANVKTGIRAQVQHLKGYASKDPLNQKCVDPRFQYLAAKRGTAKYVQSLGNGNWATDPLYASKLMGLIKLMKKY